MHTVPDNTASGAHFLSGFAVLDGAGSREAVVVGIGDGGKVAAAFAAAHPERTRALVLYNSLPLRPEWQGAGGLSMDEMITRIEQGWGTGVIVGPMGDDRLGTYFARVERRACTPHAAAVMLGAVFDADLGDVLPQVRVPTIVQHFAEHTGQPVEASRLAAAAIPGARYLELPGYSADAQVRQRLGLAGTIEEVVTGTVSVRDDDRVLAAVLFTDIVGSTEKMAEVGDPEIDRLAFLPAATSVIDRPARWHSKGVNITGAPRRRSIAAMSENEAFCHPTRE